MNDRVKTYALQTAIGYVYSRSYEPKGFRMARAQFGVPALLRFPLAPETCVICDAAIGIPALLDWVDVFGERRIIAVCCECAEPENELEQRLFKKLGLVSAAAAAE